MFLNVVQSNGINMLINSQQIKIVEAEQQTKPNQNFILITLTDGVQHKVFGTLGSIINVLATDKGVGTVKSE